MRSPNETWCVPGRQFEFNCIRYTSASITERNKRRKKERQKERERGRRRYFKEKRQQLIFTVRAK